MNRIDAESETLIVAVSPTLRAGGNKTGGDRPPGTDVDTCDSLVPVANLLNGNSGRMQVEATYLPVSFHENQRSEISTNETVGSLKVGGGKPGQGYPAIISFHGSQDPCVSEHVTHPVGRNQGQETCIAYNLRGREGGAMPEPTDVASPRSASGGSSRTYVGVRRLMPVECERLQGMADGYTAIEYNGKPAKDGPRYKAIGNSMAVPVLSWILRRIG